MTTDLRRVHDQRDQLQIVDVREPYEWELGRIDGSIHIPLNEVLAGQERGRIDRLKPVVLVCKVGNRSELATMMLRARGYDAQNLEGGLEAWTAQGLPLIDERAQPGRVA